MKLKHFIFLPFILVLTACPNAEGEGSSGGENDFTYPDTPDDLVIRLDEDGGMMPRGEDIFICQDSAYWKLWNQGNETVVRWIPLEEDFNNLYQVLKDNKFDKIEADCEGEVFDRGGTSIEIELDGKEFELNNAQNCFIKEKCRGNFRSINTGIRTYVDTEVGKKMFDVTLSTSDNAFNSGMPLTVGVNDQNIHHHERRGPRDTTITVYPGLNQIYVQFFYQDSMSSYGGPVTWKSDQVFLDCDKTTTKILIDLEADGIEVIKIP